ncbi:MAG: WecB/TagA/CpsF family glycosyltransferase [Akkermansiaceae bacterium]|nr:WecB/TagA/CpsF family glycosyltransferase [Roseibacillus sp.]
MSDLKSEAAAKAGVRTVPICGLPIAVLDYARAVEIILTWAQDRERAYAVEAANTHVAAQSRYDKAFGAAINRFDLICPDGMPLIWAANHQIPEEERMSDRVYGPNLMLRTIEASVGTPVRHFFLGGKKSTLEKLEARFAKDCPGAELGGSYSPPFGAWPDDEFERICERIRETRSNVIWVGLGCPKQETWIGNHKNRLPPGVYLGVGAAFAFHAGELKQAPPFLQRIGMEWSYRLLMEPRRLFKRYLVNNALFVGYWLADTIKRDD